MSTIISLITVGYNSASVLKECWTWFDKVSTDDKIEWILVDNNSSDKTAQVGVSLGAKVIELPENVGFAAANNIGERSAKGEILAFINPDVIVEQKTLQELARKLDHTNLIIAPQLVNSDGSLQENGRGNPYLLAKILHRLAPGRVKGTYTIFTKPNETKNVRWVIGAAMMMTRKTFHRLGGWNEDYFLYYEDIDICLRASQLEIDIQVDGSFRWLHHWAQEASGINLKAWLYEIRSGYKFYKKYPRYLMPKVK